MLRHKRFGIASEDDVLRAMTLWLRNPFITDEQISSIIEVVNWNYVSFPCLIAVAKQNSKLRVNKEFKLKFEEKCFRSTVQYSNVT